MVDREAQLFVLDGNRVVHRQIKDLNIFDGSDPDARFALSPSGRLYVKHPVTGGLHEVTPLVLDDTLILQVSPTAA